ncbi:MAG: hypothetical protein J1E43_05465 [Christensenellaceae bacterium]|nr:hypothetical protein [Christensenellaceae bacterium]
MSEMVNNDRFSVPPPQDFDTVGFQGSMQQVLQENIGSYVIVDFLIGTGNLDTRQGVLYTVASQFLVLFDDINLRYIVCDIFSVKFVTFLLPGYRPGQVRETALEDLVANQARANEIAESAGRGTNSSTGNLDTTGSDVINRQFQSTSNVNASETMARMPVTTAQAAYAHVRKADSGTLPRR